MIYFFFTVCSYVTFTCEANLALTKYKDIEDCIRNIGPVVERQIIDNPDKFIYAVCAEDLRRL